MRARYAPFLLVGIEKFEGALQIGREDQPVSRTHGPISGRHADGFAAAVDGVDRDASAHLHAR